MKTKTFFSTVFFVLLFFSIYIKAENTNSNRLLDNEQERTKTFNVSKGGKLFINVNPGEIKISAWEKDEVVVKVRGLEEAELNNVQMSLSGNTVTIKYEPEWGWGTDGEFIITIPSRFNIEAKTSGGDIAVISDVTGGVELSSLGGDLKIKNINGNTKLSTKGGDVTTGNISGSLSINTMGGDIKIGDVNGGYTKLHTMGGDIRVGTIGSGIGATTFGGDIDINGIGGDADINTMGGNINVMKINGKVKLETKGGNIRAKNGLGSINAVTFGGEIELSNITGSIDAKTLAGNIIAELIPAQNSKSRLVTQNGEIEIILPQSAKASIDAEVRLWSGAKRMKSGFGIESDFTPVEYSGEGNDNKIKGIYSINGGGGKIEVKTTNGRIKIKKK